jgi:tetratricopeptide (TPR) repeat protein
VGLDPMNRGQALRPRTTLLPRASPADRPERPSPSSRRGGTWPVLRFQQAIADSRQIRMARSQQAAIANHTALVTDDSLGPAAYPSLDQVDYYLAYEYEQAGDLANARRVYLDLIEKMPSSPFVAIGYLALGELLSRDAISDPTKWEAAKQAYMKVIATPSRRHAAYAYAWLRLGQIAEHRGDRSLARAAYTKVTEFAMNSPDVAGAVLVATQVPDWARQSPDAGADAGADRQSPGLDKNGNAPRPVELRVVEAAVGILARPSSRAPPPRWAEWRRREMACSHSPSPAESLLGFGRCPARPIDGSSSHPSIA